MIFWLLGALAVGVLIAGVIIGVSYLRSFRRNKNSKVLVADMNEFIKNMPDKDRHSMSFDDFEKCKDQKFVTEFDPFTNEVIQTKMADKGLDDQVQSAVNSHGGYIIVGD